MALYILGVRAPYRERVVSHTDVALGSPHDEKRAGDTTSRGRVCVVVLEVDGGGRTVVLTARPDCRGIGEAADILCYRLLGERRARSGPLVEFATQEARLLSTRSALVGARLARFPSSSDAGWTSPNPTQYGVTRPC